MRRLIRIAGALVALVALAGFFIPDTHRVERGTAINAPPERIDPLVAARAGSGTARPKAAAG